MIKHDQKERVENSFTDRVDQHQSCLIRKKADQNCGLNDKIGPPKGRLSLAALREPVVVLKDFEQQADYPSCHLNAVLKNRHPSATAVETIAALHQPASILLREHQNHIDESHKCQARN